MAVRVLVLRAPGVNCDVETTHAFELAGAAVDSIHVRRLLGEPHLLSDYQILCLPGGFSYGDDIASGRILGNQLRLGLAEACQAFRDAGKLVLGICNGFQVLLKTGLLDVDDDAGAQVTLTQNDSGRFEARWVELAARPERCVFLRGVERLELPVAHAEGKLVCHDANVLTGLIDAGRDVLRYVAPGAAATNAPVAHPANPNGAVANLAGICDRTGRVLGLMPHPERFVDPTQHPTWTRGARPASGDGLAIFTNAVNYFA